MPDVPLIGGWDALILGFSIGMILLGGGYVVSRILNFFNRKK